MVKITAEPIDPSQVYGLIAVNGAGSVVLHCAVVKPVAGAGGTTSYIEFASVGDTAAELDDIAGSLSAEFDLEDVVLIRRTGRIGLGEIISLVAASSVSSENSFGACKTAISRLKKMKSITKHEVCV